MVQVMLQLLFQGFELRRSLAQIAFKFRHFLEVLQYLFRLLVILEVGFLHHLFKFGIVGIGQFERFRRRDSGMLQAILCGIIKDKIIIYQIEKDVR